MEAELLSEQLNNEIEHLNIERENLISAFNDLKTAYEKLERENNIREKYLDLIAEKSFDYDGYNSIEGLKTLIDEMDYYANLGRKADDKRVIYHHGDGTKRNILNEIVGE